MDYDPALARAILTRTPDLLRTWLPGLPAEWLDAPEGPGAWSPRDVACHLADLEGDGWLPRVRIILEHGTARPFVGIERERFRERFAGAPLGAVLDEFAAARARNIEALDGLGLDPALLATRGRHPVFGEVTLAQLLSTWVVHDLTHLAQISRALAAQYREAVGPWIQNLSVLRARGSADERAPRAGG
ncbi:MAG TPA: DinB family protein [Longimicrobiales bacterium]|nr:DinB family protein [Longimicrobiales bacterium]